MQIVELLTRHLFRSEERANDAQYRQTVAQIQTLQRHVFRQIRVRFLERHGQIEGSRMAQLTVDKLFGSIQGERRNRAPLKFKVVKKLVRS